MMSADFHHSLSAALNLTGKDQYCKNREKQELEERKGNSQTAKMAKRERENKIRGTGVEKST